MPVPSSGLRVKVLLVSRVVVVVCLEVHRPAGKSASSSFAAVASTFQGLQIPKPACIPCRQSNAVPDI